MDQFEACDTGKLSYNQVLDITDIEPSGGITEPVTLTEAKNFCKIDVSDDDTLITMLLTSCRLECESLTNIGFVNRNVIVVQNNGNGGAFLPLGPNGDIATVQDTDGNDLTYVPSGTTWKQIISPRSERLVITYNTGYTTLPANLKLALLECIFYRYDERKVRENAHPPIYIDLLKQVARIW
jgi:hypothetical protein